MEVQMRADGNPSPYERIGGDRAVEEIVFAFYQRVIADPELSEFFRDTDIDRLLAMQREYVATALGGPGTYSSSALRDAHSGRGIRGRHFVRFLDLFMETLGDRGLDAEDIDLIMDRMAIASTDVLDRTTEAG
jgi:hemoglobin